MIVDLEQETDGRWLAKIDVLPGALAYGATREEAARKVEALALRILAERLENGEAVPALDGTSHRSQVVLGNASCSSRNSISR
jgi:predicted RNase H-like HicB family nuclease